MAYPWAYPYRVRLGYMLGYEEEGSPKGALRRVTN